MLSGLTDEELLSVAQKAHRIYQERVDKISSTFPELSQEEAKLARNGYKVHAIRQYNRRTELGLLESKVAVEKYLEKGG
jgi:ribosomal protein L7/L12